MTNKDIARAFQLLSGLMELHGENPFKIRSYQNAYVVLRKLETPLSEMSDAEIGAVPGLGKAIVGKIRELLEKGEMDKLEEFRAKTPEGIQEMLSIKGLGPKKIKQIWQEMEIESPGELLYACEENRLIEMKGFGLKTQQELKEKIRYWLDSRKKFLYAQAESLVAAIESRLKSSMPLAEIIPAGEYRRKCPIIHKLEFLVVGADPDLLVDQPGLEILKRENSTLLVQIGEDLEFTLHFAGSSNKTEALLIHTGPEEFVSALKEKHPVFPGDSKSEKDLFANLDEQYILPELRDAENPQILAARTDESGLVEVEDLKGVLHNHSTYSDGIHSLREISSFVRDEGFEYFGISDHSRSAFYANGLDADRVLRQFEEIETLNAEMDSFRIFKGIESDILGDGSLDYEEDILRQFEFIVASIHSNLRMEMEKATQRLITAVENPYTRILGHPTGRLLLSRKGYPIDHRKIIDACAANGVVIELNANPLRLDIDYTWIPFCLEKGVMISINPDAHSKEAIHQMRFGVYAARKAGLPPEMCLNCMSLVEFEDWLSKK